MVGPDAIFYNRQAHETPEALNGFTTKGNCTLVGLHELTGPGRFDGRTLQGVRLRLFRADHCVHNCHLASDDKPLLRSVECVFSAISAWLPGVGRVQFAEESVSQHWPTSPCNVFDVCIPAHKTRVSLDVVPRGKFSAGGGRTSIRSEARFIIEPDVPQSLAWFWDIVHRIEGYLSLVLGTPVRPEVFCIKTTESEEGYLVTGRKALKPRKWNRQLSINCDGSRLALTLSAWLSSPPEFRPVENLYAMLRTGSLFVETEFLALAQALESFHRLSKVDTLVPSADFDEILEELNKTIEGRCKSPALAGRLREAIQFANGPNFKVRIEQLMGRVSADQIRQLLGDPVEFEETLRRTRNARTHPGIKKQARALTDAGDLFLFNQKLYAFLRLLMLLNIGFAEGEAFAQVLYQSRRYGMI
jgi:hypothetical protein